jgi:hypothetical protein
MVSGLDLVPNKKRKNSICRGGKKGKIGFVEKQKIGRRPGESGDLGCRVQGSGFRF